MQSELLDIIKRDFIASQEIEYGLNDLESICLVVGPYRNLTTLLSAIVSLHPNIQVLNHAFERVLTIKNINFFDEFQIEKLDSFIKYVIYISASGTRGSFGGSILHSHAFANYPGMQAAYTNRYGKQTVKKNIKSIFWKESLTVTRYLQNLPEKSLDSLLENNKKIKLLLPIRNPIDCGISNLKTGSMAKELTGKKLPELRDAFTAIIKIFEWFQDIKRDHPEQTIIITQRDLENKSISSISSFLGVKETSEWTEDIINSTSIKPSYVIDNEITNLFTEIINKSNLSVSLKNLVMNQIN
ncbi:sulfotransferase domain-containing protein [Litoribrevibacter euphylliae]|uniref:Sulfotransferase domain-containing protein n=1 Tax=Litoribrevibacter euphylliae TaxID=1834034 RepID=A0ABV7H8F0_9GAMM